MSRPKPTPVPLHALTPGQSGDFFALLAERTRSATRDNKPYYNCRFRDAQRVASCMIWSDSPHFEECEHHWKAGQFFKVRGVYQEHKQYGPQIDIHQVRPVTDADVAEGFDPLDLVESSRFDPKGLLAELIELVQQHIKDEPLRRLVLTIVERHQEPLQRLPATVKHFYTFQGGLIEHVVSVARSCLHLAQKYSAHYPDLQPPLNVDLVVAGAVLHDIGRVLDLDAGVLTPVRTTAGGLLGHLLLGRDLVRDTAREQGDVDPELLQLLEHILIAHLDHAEWGTPRPPLLPECLIVHYADELDSRMEMFVRCLERDQETGTFTARDPVLGRQLLRKRTK